MFHEKPACYALSHDKKHDIDIQSLILKNENGNKNTTIFPMKLADYNLLFIELGFI